MPSATALIETDRPERWAKQLASHFSHRCETEPHPEGTLVHFSAGDGVIGVRGGELLLVAYAQTLEQLTEVQNVLGRHLERFAAREALTVSWGDLAD